MLEEEQYQYLLSVLDRAENGPIVEEKDWDRDYVALPISELIEKYDIRWDIQGNIVPFDDDLSDRVFVAGMDLAVKSGLYCLDTKRQMIWSHDELEKAIWQTPTKVLVGEGEDARWVYKRDPDGAKRVTIWGGAFGVPFPEDLLMPMLESYAREPLIDILDNGTLLSAHGRSIRAGSPWEAVGAWREAQITLDVLRRVGRAGLSVGCVNIATTEVGELAGSTYDGYRPTDVHKVSFIAEQKTAYHQLTKAVHNAHTNALSEAFCDPMYGGYSGGAEGLAVAIVAQLILLKACYLGTLICASPAHVHLDSNTHPEMISAMSLAFQALSRNTKLLTLSFVRPSTGPGTKELFYECAAMTIASVVSGVSGVDCVQTAGGNNTSHASPLEVRFSGQVAHAVEGMSRKDALPVVNRLVDKYKALLTENRIGKPFQEVYDLETLQPTTEWQAIYEQACIEMDEIFGIEII